MNTSRTFPTQPGLLFCFHLFLQIKKQFSWCTVSWWRCSARFQICANTVFLWSFTAICFPRLIATCKQCASCNAWIWGWCSIMPWSQPRLWVAPLPQTTTISGREDTKETLTIWRKEGRTMILSRGPQQSLPDMHSHCWLLRKCWLSLPPQPSLRMRLCRCSRQLLKARSLLPLSHLFNVLLSVSILTWVGR